MIIFVAELAPVLGRRGSRLDLDGGNGFDKLQLTLPLVFPRTMYMQKCGHCDLRMPVVEYPDHLNNCPGLRARVSTTLAYEI
jgi:hypothetical protein